ncbi:hypothetical protein K0B96_15625 [Horticoccus luteus]|uniref:Alpha-L-fucosidase n=1 Tax=Horticoccus luteus TaxID=2862869 RepID=A0A8F9TVG0_9BACT|nr:hypothetical protein [Horticoccus luteus]QYM78711.1 hypothetical protein K0B96_15625 [Horticoccus luteus]
MSSSPSPTPWKRADTTWFRDCRWGLFVHYLADSASNLQPIALSTDDWNRRIDAFDVDGLAQQLSDARVPYFVITLGQNSGFYLSPNATYDAIVGRQPSRCSQRDLIADLSRALAPRGIRLLAYLPGTAPRTDELAKTKLEGTPDARSTELLRNWEAVVREWSLRWGSRLSGWWIDGPYDQAPYQHPDAPNYRSFAEALKAGNPDAIVTFNNGLRTPIYSSTEFEDYTAGEIERDLSVAPGCLPDYSRLRNYERYLDGAQLHALTIMGEWWGTGPVRFPDELTIGYTKFINSKGGVVSWDAPLTVRGHLDPAFQPHIAALGRAIAQDKANANA